MMIYHSKPKERKSQTMGLVVRYVSKRAVNFNGCRERLIGLEGGRVETGPNRNLTLTAPV